MAIKFLKKVKLNNAGMTLVELVVAIAILSVGIIPLLYAFVNATRYNAKGRELQQTTVLAHTIMENCKAYSKEEIDEQMLTSHNFLDYTVAGYSSKSSGAGTTYYMTGVEVENFVYDVEMTITPYGIGDSAITEYKMMAMESMNPYKDAIFTPDSSVGLDASGNVIEGAAILDEEMYITALEKVAEGLKTQAALNPLFVSPLEVPVSELEDELSDGTGNELKLYRTITIEIGNITGTANEIVTVTYEYSFELTADKYTYVYEYFDEFGTLQTENVIWNMPDIESIGDTVTYTIYNNTDTYVHNTGAQVENIYFCYYPGYKGTTALCPIEEDTIIIDNGLGRAVNVYLIKQKNLAYDDYDLTSLEAGYVPKVQGNSITMINLFHNYKDDLSGSGGVMNIPTENGFNLPEDADQPDPMILEEEKTLMYKISLAIYEAGSYDSGNNKIKDGRNPMVTLKGTSLD